MVDLRTVDAGGISDGTASQMGLAQAVERDVVPAARRLAVADAAAGIVPAGLDGAALVLRLAGQWLVVLDQPRPGDDGARGAGSRGQPECLRDRQSVGENHGKRRASRI